MDEFHSKSIGVFDSGFGGLTILHHLKESLPDHSFIYLGDNARAPYGTRDRETVTRYTEEAINFLFDQGAALIIIACNTATTAALRYLQGKYMRDTRRTDRNILGIIIPTVEAGLSTCHNNKLGILGTPLTIQSGVFEREIEKRHPHIDLRTLACPKLVPLVESGREHTDEARHACAEYLDKLNGFDCDTIILGCTHYPYLLEHFRELRPNINFIEQGPIVALKTKEYLSRHAEIDNQLNREGNVQFFTTGDAGDFMRLGSRYYNLTPCPLSDEGVRVRIIHKCLPTTCCSPSPFMERGSGGEVSSPLEFFPSARHTIITYIHLLERLCFAHILVEN